MNLVKVSDIFDVSLGSNLELNSLELDPNGVNFVSRTAQNNGVSAKVKFVNGLDLIEAGVLTVAGGGSVAETFLQPEPFYSGRDLFYLRPKMPMTVEQKMYFCMCIRANKFRFNYGRQANKTLPSLLIPDIADVPDWVDSVFASVLEKWSSQLVTMSESS